MLETVILWVLLGSFVAFYAYRGLVETTNIFSPPLIISMLVFGVLVKSYLSMDLMAISALMDHDYYVMTMIYAALSVAIFCIAYERAVSQPSAARPAGDVLDQIPREVLLIYLTIIAVVGFAAQIYFARAHGGGSLTAYYSKAHGIAGDHGASSAYLYALPNFLWPAMLIAYIAWIKGQKRSHYLLGVFAVTGLALLAHTFLFGNRNGIIRFCILLGGAYAFIHRPTFSRSIPLLIMLALSVVAVLVIINIRHHTHLGSDITVMEAFSNYLQSLSENQGRTAVRLDGGGHELFFNVAVVQAVWQSSTYDWGMQFIYPFMNFIPRAIWPDKPYEIEFGVNVFLLVQNVLGWWAGEGAAVSAISWSFLAFSWAGAGLWGLLGYYCGRRFRAALEAPTVMNLGYLVSALLACIYWGTQSFGAVFSNWFFTIMPFVGLHVIARLWNPVMFTTFGHTSRGLDFSRPEARR